MKTALTIESVAPIKLAILGEGDRVVPITDTQEWHAWANVNIERITLGLDTINGLTVRTNFLGVSHKFGGVDDKWFKTTVYDTFRDARWAKLYETHAEALAGHKEITGLLLRNQPLPSSGTIKHGTF